MRSRVRPVRSSHRMLANAGRSNNAIMSSADSLGPCCKHFFVCQNETNTITDIKGGVVISNATTDVNVAPGTAPNTMRLLSWPNVGGGNQLALGNWYNPGDKDVLIASCGVVTGDANGKGQLSFYYGNNDLGGQLKVQPYYSVFSAALDLPIDNYPFEHQSIATPYQKSLANNTIGDDFICAAVKRGSRLEHWADGELTGTNDVTLAVPELQAAWNNYQAGDLFYCGHGVSGTPDIRVCQASNCKLPDNTTDCDCNYAARIVDANGNLQTPGAFSGADANTEVAQDYYFLAVFVFENGMPDDVGLALKTIKAQAIAGQKVGYLPWLLRK